MTVYLDMDGVIADFFGGVERLYDVDHWKSIQHRDGIFVELRNTDFFYTLDMFNNESFQNISKVILEYIKGLTWEHQMEWGICSSPLRGDEHNSAYWKRRWLEEHDWFPEASRFIVTGRKEKYATAPLDGKPNILIDDKPSNIKAWNDKGGIGIRYQANEDDLEEYLFVALEEAIQNSK